MRSKPFQLAQYILLLVAGIVLSWLFFRDVNFDELLSTLSTGNFSWFYLVMLVSVMVYIFRVLRWQMLISATGYKAGFFNAFAALSIGYFVNFAVPRLGEVTRCLSVKKQDKIPFMELLGTVIIERVIDIISLIVVLFLTLLLQFDKIREFVRDNVFIPFYDGVILKIMSGNKPVLFIVLLIIVICSFLFFYFRKYIRERSPKIVVKFIEGLKSGLTSVGKLKRKGLFISYTILIWICYYLMTYFWFFVFKETSVLGWGACLTIVSIGTIGRSVPIQGGGMGAYHFLVQQVCLLYGLVGPLGKTLATLIHAGQTFFTFVMGIVGLIIFFVGYWQRR
jgi:glycosyltransferase 2 family protein